MKHRRGPAGQLQQKSSAVKPNLTALAGPEARETLSDRSRIHRRRAIVFSSSYLPLFDRLASLTFLRDTFL